MKSLLLIVVVAFALSAGLVAQEATPATATKPKKLPAAQQTPQTKMTRALSDADCSQRIVGVWEFSATNATQWMTTKTEYRKEGTYIMRGSVGLTNRDFTGDIGDAGVWRVADGVLYTTVTNNAPGRIHGESRDEIVSISADRFTYRTEQNQTRTAIRKP